MSEDCEGDVAAMFDVVMSVDEVLDVSAGLLQPASIAAIPIRRRSDKVSWRLLIRESQALRS